MGGWVDGLVSLYLLGGGGGVSVIDRESGCVAALMDWCPFGKINLRALLRTYQHHPPVHQYLG